MLSNRHRRWLLWVPLLILMTMPLVVQSQRESLLIFAASSLTNAFTDLAEAYSATHAVDITLNFAGSSTLATQIEQGAPADIFASANELQVQRLVMADIIQPAAVSVFAHNRLVLIVPDENPAQIETAADVARPDTLVVMANPTVPIREYTDILLHTLADHYQNEYAHAVLSNVVSEETNVRQVAARVALGEADAAFVYQTDITPDIMDAVRVIALPPTTSPIARYPIAILDDQNPPAQAFIDYVLSDDGQAILRAWGFCQPEPDQATDAESTAIPDDITPTPTAHDPGDPCA